MLHGCVCARVCARVCVEVKPRKFVPSYLGEVGRCLDIIPILLGHNIDNLLLLSLLGLELPL